jgi:hypothetical protein
MNWYMAKIVFRIVCGEGTHTPQFDEQLRLVNAVSREKAYNKAFEIGMQEEDTFLNDKNEKVKWQFVNISELHKLPALTDGIELYSRVKETKNAAGFIDGVNKRAEEIRSSILHTEPQLQ